MNRYSPAHLFLLLIVLLLVPNCAPLPRPQQQMPPTANASRFTAAFAALPTSLAPYGQYSWHKAQVLALLYNGLTVLDQDLQPLPALASSWEVSPDGLVYTVHLRRGVLFHHGQELEAADVHYSFQQAAAAQLARQEAKPPLAIITAINVPDRHTIRFELKEPYAPFLTELTVACCPIIPRNAPPTSQALSPGTGPFQVVNFQPGQALTLKQFAAYWEHGLPRLDTIILRGVDNAATRLRLLETGEVDYVLLDPLQASIPSVEVSNDVVQVHSAPTGTFSVIFNTRRQPFANTNVRRAFAWATDKPTLAQQVLGTYGVPVNQPFSPEASPWYTNIADRSLDVDKARELLTQAGYPEGIEVSLPVVAHVALFTKTALVLQEQLRQAGIHLQVEIVPMQSMLNKMQHGEWDLLLRGETSQPDPDQIYFAAFHSSRVSTSNVSGYYTPALDALLTAGRRSLSRRQRQQIYRQVVSQIQQDVPELYLFMARWPVAWHRRVQGYDHELLRCCLMHTLTAIANQGFKTIWLAE